MFIFLLGPIDLIPEKNRAWHCITFLLLNGYRNSAPLWSPWRKAEHPLALPRITSYYLIADRVEGRGDGGLCLPWASLTLGKKWRSRVPVGIKLHCLILPSRCLIDESSALCLVQLRTIWWDNLRTIRCCQGVGWKFGSVFNRPETRGQRGEFSIGI